VRDVPVSPNVFALSARACVSTHLLPLPETVVVLVEPLPRRNVVLAVKTREVGHAALRVSDCVRGLSVVLPVVAGRAQRFAAGGGQRTRCGEQ
jgi:hypothetical protein